VLKKIPFFLIAGICFLCLICPVFAAESKTHELTNIAEYTFSADDGDVVYEIIINPIAMGKNQTHYLSYEGADYILTVGSAQSFVVYHTFDVSLEHPNGTIEHHTKSYTGISSGSYTLNIQPVYYHAQSLNPSFSVWVNVGLAPLKTEFYTTPPDVTSGGGVFSGTDVDPQSSIPFTDVSGTMGQETTVYIYTMTQEEFTNEVTTYNAYGGLKSVVDDVLSWAWSGVISFLNAIPVIGPFAVTFISYAGIILYEMFFWLSYLILNFPAIVLTAETMIMFAALINSRDSLSSILKNWYGYNVSAIKGLVWFLDLVRGWIVSLIEMISNIVSSLH
jgi:hypothetical protein